MTDQPQRPDGTPEDAAPPPAPGDPWSDPPPASDPEAPTEHPDPFAQQGEHPYWSVPHLPGEDAAPGQAPPAAPAYGQAQPGYGQPAYGQPAYGQPAYGQPGGAQDPYGAQTPYPPNPYDAPAPQAQNPYAAQAPEANPYAVAPGPMSMNTGSIGFVEANFGRVAQFGDRALAYLIDAAISLSGLILVVLGVIILAVSGQHMVTLDNGATTLAPADPVMVTLGVIFVVLGFLTMFGLWLWNRVFRMGRTGQSVGKQMQGLMLIDGRTGRPIGAGAAFVRDVVHGVVNQVFYLSFLWMLWDPDKQTVGDKAVHSAVVHVPTA